MVSLRDQETSLKLIIVMLKYDSSGQLIFMVDSLAKTVIMANLCIFAYSTSFHMLYLERY
ncbi:hypothetical protein SAMN05443144_10896 [Fodinibius roseus]|uniref:Uncharacterized protein n=1 Tax=Fodinibius roseus TaxID=1194090 RepID=A0A1M5BEN0_9BACT|nr:hypothetical protein SAMN05443144_10896 [Fodinibius roseus]